MAGAKPLATDPLVKDPPMRKPRLFVAALLVVTAVAAPASATHGPTGAEFVPNLRTERVYFYCEGDTKVHNTVTNDSVPWDTTAPTQSVTQGAGCGTHDNPLQGNNQVSVQDSHFGGLYEGNLDTLSVELHNIYVGQARSAGPLTFNVRLAVDGVPILGATGKDVAVTPVRSSSGASEMVKFTITGIGLLTEADDFEHDVLMTISGGKVAAQSPAFPIRDTLSAWVYDTTEVPSGLTFNPATTEAVTVQP